MTADGNNTLVYDAENRVLSATNGGASGAYTYDGNGLRVEKVSGGTTTVYIFSGSKVIAEYDNGALPTAPSREYIYSGGALLAKLDSSGATYYHPDQRSNRLTTDSSGNLVAQMGHYPFGDSWYNSTNDKLQFTTYSRDAESGNDYAMARSYINRLGRFSSPDPLGGSSADPQSLNRYAYTLNDPIDFMDPSGTRSLFYLVASSDPFFFLDYLITGEGATNDGWSAGNFNGDLINWILGQSDQNNPVRVGGNRSGGNGAAPKLHLQVESDCLGGFGREIQYALLDENNNQVSNLYVTEHQTDTSLANVPGEPPGTSTDPPPPYPAKTPFASGFNDTLGGLGFHNSLQTFTVSPNPPGTAGPNYPVFVRDMNGNDYGTLGTWMQNGQVFVNGKLAKPRN
jgi:RHS repeat-associated protein